MRLGVVRNCYVFLMWPFVLGAARACARALRGGGYSARVRVHPRGAAREHHRVGHVCAQCVVDVLRPILKRQEEDEGVRSFPSSSGFSVLYFYILYLYDSIFYLYLYFFF